MKKSERDAAAKAEAILKRASARGEEVGGDYGGGKLTKHQRKSQEKHIPWSEGPSTTKGRIARKLWG